MSFVAKSCLTLLWPFGLQTLGSSCLWDFPGKNTQVVAISFSRGSFWPRDRIHISCLAGVLFTNEPPGEPLYLLYSPCSELKNFYDVN